MASIGFNPIPNISLGDMEDIFDIENELAIMSDKDTKPSATALEIDKDKIVKQFMLDEIVNVTVIKEDCEGLIEYTEDENSDDVEEDGIDDSELDGYTDEDESSSEDDQFDIDESELIVDETEDEPQEIKPPAKTVKTDADRREEELLARIKLAEENKRIEEEKNKRLKLLEEEAIRAEQEAIRVKKLREQEALRIEQERKEQERKVQAERKLKEEQEALKAQQAEFEKKEKLKQLLASKKRQETLQFKQSIVDSVKSDIKSTPIQAASDYDMYNNLDIDALYAEVRKFLKLHNVEKKITDIKILENQFGKANIKKLILKSYLISIGKGVTIGK